jgi:hypothetical protein
MEKPVLNNIRIYLIKKLIGKKFKVVSNITITSDIIKYNKGLDIDIFVKVKKVSDTMSFIYNPTNTTHIYK